MSTDQPSPRETLTINDVCEILGVSRRTVYNWMAKGQLKFVRTPGGSRRIYADLLYRLPQPVFLPETVAGGPDE